MSKVVAIICNGEFPQSAYPLNIIRQADFIVCCDGAIQKFLQHSPQIFGYQKLPNIVIGDLDSIPATIKNNLDCKVVHIQDQETNDQTKAFNYVINNIASVGTIHFIGATGLREDHTIGNISLLMEYAKILENKPIKVDIISNYSIIFALTQSACFNTNIGNSVSICSPDNSLNIKSKGLVWPTDNVVFDNWWKATLNKAAATKVCLTFSHKSMAIVILAI